MITFICVLLSAAAFYSSTGVGDIWPLAWFAPLPILWLAFGRTRTRTVAAAAFVAMALGSTNILNVDTTSLPLVTILVTLIVPALLFTVSILAGRFVAGRVSPLLGVLAFSTLWTALGYLASFGPYGTAANIAYSQVGAPVMIQSASVFGLWSIAFLLAYVPASVALSLQRRHVLPAVIGVALFATNLLFGGIALGAHGGSTIRVALIADNEMSDAGLADDGHVALATIDSYDREVLRSVSDNVRLVVFPEKLAIIEPPWKAQAQAKLSMTAKAMNATLVAGFENRDGNSRTNIAWVFPSDGGAPRTYEKRHLAPVLEEALTPGQKPLVLPDSIGVDIGNDMDFGGMIRSDSKSHPRIVAVPAQDFGADGFSHARMAIMRGVENGFAVARAARIGLLSLSDARGNLKGVGTWPNGFTTFEANIELGRDGGNTVYDRIGDVFAWLCMAASAGFLLAGFVRDRALSKPSPSRY